MADRNEFIPARDEPIADGNPSIADGNEVIAVGHRIIVDGNEEIAAENEVSPVGNDWIAVRKRIITYEPETRTEGTETIMPTTITSIHRAIVSLNVPTKNADVIVYGTNIVQKMTANPIFPTPTPSVAALLGAVTDLHNAQTATLSRTKGAATLRNSKRAALVALLQRLGAYVQTVADATPENGAVIIESSGLAVRKVTPRGKRPFVAKQGTLSGSAEVTALSPGGRASYEWQYSVDGGKTWVAAPGTTRGRTTITGFAPATSVQFRYLTVTPKGGQSDWSQPTSLIVK